MTASKPTVSGFVAKGGEVDESDDAEQPKRAKLPEPAPKPATKPYVSESAEGDEPLAEAEEPGELLGRVERELSSAPGLLGGTQQGAAALGPPSEELLAEPTEAPPAAVLLPSGGAPTSRAFIYAGAGVGFVALLPVIIWLMMPTPKDADLVRGSGSARTVAAGTSGSGQGGAAPGSAAAGAGADPASTTSGSAATGASAGGDDDGTGAAAGGAASSGGAGAAGASGAAGSAGAPGVANGSGSGSGTGAAASKGSAGGAVGSGSGGPAIDPDKAAKAAILGNSGKVRSARGVMLGVLAQARYLIERRRCRSALATLDGARRPARADWQMLRGRALYCTRKYRVALASYRTAVGLDRRMGNDAAMLSHLKRMLARRKTWLPVMRFVAAKIGRAGAALIVSGASHRDYHVRQLAIKTALKLRIASRVRWWRALSYDLRQMSTCAERRGAVVRVPRRRNRMLASVLRRARRWRNACAYREIETALRAALGR